MSLPVPDLTTNLFNLSGYCSIVTGAGQGIGLALAKGLSYGGSNLVLVDLNAETLDHAAGEIRSIGRNVSTVTTDVTSDDAPARMVAAAKGLSGRIDVLINNAGIMGYADMLTVTDDGWDRMYGVNLRAPMRIMRAVLPEMVAAGRGSVINIGSSWSSRASVFNQDGGGVDYCSAKSALQSLTRAAAQDVAAHGVRVNAIAPGAVDTPMHAHHRDYLFEYETYIPLGRMQVAEDLAGPMEKAMANLDGTLNERYIAYARERAEGGAALIQLESAYVSPEGRGNPYQVGCHGDHVIPGLTWIADAVHQHGGKLAMGLNHSGRQSSATAHHRQPIGPSAVASTAMDPGSIPRAMTQADIERVIGDFARAAERCLRAGVDMIHLHGTHGYLLGQFLSPRPNRRSDGYGGALENRARLALEVLAAIRQTVGPDYPIGYRMLAREYVEGGLELEETAVFATMLADGGVDLIDVAGGTYESMATIFQGAGSPKGGFVADAAAIRRTVGDRVPVSVAQRLNDPVFANAVMEREGFSFICLTRGFHADPHYVRKLAAGTPSEILPCIGCNTCVNLTVHREVAGCAANPLTTYEASRVFEPVTAPQRAPIVGGGVAGMHAAWFLALQGHEVTLCEAG